MTPLTVIGGYLGAGKTTLVNRLLHEPEGRRLGVIVNDFGSTPIDAELLADATRDGDVIGLANGCVCCTVGAGLHESLEALVQRDPPVDHIVIEVSGVADPAAAAAWGTVPPFEPGGVIVLVAADQVMALRQDRYVGSEVRRQIAGADLLAVTKTDLVDAASRHEVLEWLATESPAPQLEVSGGVVPADVVLGIRSERPPIVDGHDHGDRYVSWSWTSNEPVSRSELDQLLADVDPDVLRIKGIVRLTDGTDLIVQVVGRRVVVTSVGRRPGSPPSQLVAIAVSGAASPFP